LVGPILVVNFKLSAPPAWILRRRHNKHMTANIFLRSVIEACRRLINYFRQTIAGLSDNSIQKNGGSGSGVVTIRRSVRIITDVTNLSRASSAPVAYYLKAGNCFSLEAFRFAFFESPLIAMTV
jgi:hypothetical protein